MITLTIVIALISHRQCLVLAGDGMHFNVKRATLCDYFQTAQRGGEAAVRGGSRAPESAAQEGPPRLQISAEAEEIGQERAERPGGRRADAHLPERDLQGAAAGRLSGVQPGRGAFTWRALR